MSPASRRPSSRTSRKPDRPRAARLVDTGRPPRQAQPPPRRVVALRAAVERHSARPLLVLLRAPRWLVAVLMAASGVAGLVITGIAGAVCLLVLALFLSWLAYLSWPAVPARARLVRVLVVAVVLVLAAVQLIR